MNVYALFSQQYLVGNLEKQDMEDFYRQVRILPGSTKQMPKWNNFCSMYEGIVVSSPLEKFFIFREVVLVETEENGKTVSRKLIDFGRLLETSLINKFIKSRMNEPGFMVEKNWYETLILSDLKQNMSYSNFLPNDFNIR